MVLTVSFALSLVSRAFLPPSPAQCESIVADLISTSGYQDHATSPSAPDALVSRAKSVHRIPHPTFVTIAIRPSEWARDGCDMEVICARDQPEAPATNQHDGQIT